MVATSPLIFQIQQSLYQSLVTVPRELITISVNVSFMFDNFFNSLTSSK